MEKAPSWGGFFVVLRIIKQRCDQLRVLVYSPDVGPIVGPKVWSLSYIFFFFFFDCPVARGGVLVIAY